MKIILIFFILINLTPQFHIVQSLRYDIEGNYSDIHKNIPTTFYTIYTYLQT